MREQRTGMIIDFHTHAFPDDLAAKALKEISEKSGATPSHNGTVSDLFRSMDDAGIETASIPSSAAQGTEIQDRDDARHLLDLVADLPAREQELLRLRYQGELTYKQISQVTGLSVSNVGYILNQAINRLRDAVKAEERLCLAGHTS